MALFIFRGYAVEMLGQENPPPEGRAASLRSLNLNEKSSLVVPEIAWDPPPEDRVLPAAFGLRLDQERLP